MKKYLLFILLMAINLINSQIVEEFKNINVPSPQAFEMIKYGNISMDESNGVANLNIPIYNYSTGEINIPISLGATTSPLLVNQAPTWTGVNWNLLAGGVITRHVKDQPDDKICPKYNYTYEYLNSVSYFYESQLANGVNYTFPQEVINNIKNHNADSELDEFNFNFLNYNGSFVIKKDANSNPIVLLKENKIDLKIEIIGVFNENSDYAFKITTPDGFMFYFGGIYITPNNQTEFGVEKTKFYLKNIDPTGANGYTAKTAFYLTSIESYKGDKVYFDYETLADYQNFYRTEQKLYNVIHISNPNCTEYMPIQPYEDEIHVREVYNIINKGMILYKIRNSINLNSVLFESIPIIENNKYYGKILSKIKFEAKEVELNYNLNKNSVSNFIDLNSAKKFFLTEVVFKDSNLETNNKYKIEYEDLENIPSVYSFSQDHLGYYNGQNNLSLLPKDHFILANHFIKTKFPVLTNNIPMSVLRTFDFNHHNTTIFADRDGYFQYATNGIIKKIIYPTGGFTEFQYQPELLKPIYNNILMEIRHSPLPSGSYSSIMEQEFLILNYELNEDETTEINDFINQTVEFEMHFGGSRLNVSGYNTIDYRDYMYVLIKDLTNNTEIEERLHVPADQAMDMNLNSVDAASRFTYNFKKEHNYSIKIGFGDNIYGGYINTHNPEYLENIGGYVKFKIMTGFDENDGIGVRLKNNKDYDSNGALKNTRRYFYQKLSDVVLHKKENNNFKWLPQYNDYKYFNHPFNCPYTGDNLAIYFYNVLTSNSNSSLSPSQFYSNKYQFLTIIEGENGFNNGAIEKEFNIVNDQREFPFMHNFYAGEEVYTYYNITYNMFPLFEILRGFKNSRTETETKGELLKESIYKFENNQLKKKSEVSFKYSYSLVEEIGNINLIEDLGCVNCQQDVIGNYYLGLYKTKINKIHLTSKISRDFIDAIPVTLHYQNFHVKENKFWDFDNDGIPNYLDYITEEEFNLQFKHLEKLNTFWYGNPSNRGLLEKETEIYNGNTRVKKYFYPKPDNINLLSNLNNNDASIYLSLFQNYRINEPIEIQESLNNEVLFTKRYLYSYYDNFSTSKPLLNKVLYSKGINSFEYNHEISKYDDFGNIAEIKVKDLDMFTSFQWYNRKLKVKAENMQYSSLISELNNSNINYNTYGGYPMFSFIQNNPNSFFTLYSYNQLNLRLQKIFDSNYNMTQYFYDAYYNLNMIKDNDGNIIQEFDQQFKPQN